MRWERLLNDHTTLIYNATIQIIIILIDDIQNVSKKCHKFYQKLLNKNGDRLKFDRRRLRAKKAVALVLLTGNVFQTVTDLKKLLAILLVRQKGFNREGPDERVEIGEGIHIVK